jgi:hypothetical protein
MTDLKSSLARAKAELGIALAALDRAIAASDVIPFDMIAHPQVRAAQILSSMRRRATIIDPPLNEGCWAILLDLYANQGKRRVSVSSASIASGGPPTTGLRWIGLLLDAGLIERIADARDGRRVHLELTQRGFSAVVGYLQI